MTTTLGRVSLTSAPYDVSQVGDQMSFSIDIVGYSLAVAKVLRQQMLGLNDNADEPVVPMTSALDSDYDGFYRVLGVSVEPTIVYQRDGTMRCQVSLERVGGGFAKPVFETSLIAAPRSDGPATLNPNGATNWLASGFPLGVGEAGASGYSGGVAPATSGTVSYTTATGAIHKVIAFTSLAAADSDVYQHYSEPADAYAGACLVEVQIGGTWYPATGRQVPLVGRGWRISNGIVRLSLSQSTLGALLIEVWGGSVWESSPLLYRLNQAGTTAGYYGLIDPTTNGDTTAVDPVVVRNAPECVSVRIPQRYGNSETYSVSRGQPYASLLVAPMANLSAANSLGGVRLVTPAAVTVITSTILASAGGAVEWGMYTATDGNGNKLLVAAPEQPSSASPVDTANGEMHGIDASSNIVPLVFMFGVTSDPTGGTVAEFETSAVAASMFTVVASQQQVVAR